MAQPTPSDYQKLSPSGFIAAEVAHNTDTSTHALSLAAAGPPGSSSSQGYISYFFVAETGIHGLKENDEVVYKETQTRPGNPMTVSKIEQSDDKGAVAFYAVGKSILLT